MIDESAPDGPAVELLKPHDIEVFNHVGYPAEIMTPVAIRKQVFPAVRYIIPVSSGRDPELYVVAEKAQGTPRQDRIGLINMCRCHSRCQSLTIT